MNFTSQHLLDLLLTSRLKDVLSLVIFHLYFSLISGFIKILFNGILYCSYFINSSFKRKSVQMLIRVSIRVCKIRYFSFTFKLNKKNKVLLKKYNSRGVLQQMFCSWKEAQSLYGAWEYSKKGGLDKTWVMKK